jgi:hypothetical protein
MALCQVFFGVFSDLVNFGIQTATVLTMESAPRV